MRAITSTQPKLSAEAGLFVFVLRLHSPRSITSATTKKSHVTKFASPLANQEVGAITSTQPELSAEAGLFIFALRLHCPRSITSAPTTKSHPTSARPPTPRNQDQRPAHSAAARRSGSDGTNAHRTSNRLALTDLDHLPSPIVTRPRSLSPVRRRTSHLKFLLVMFIAFNRAIDELLGLSNR